MNIKKIKLLIFFLAINFHMLFGGHHTLLDPSDISNLGFYDPKCSFIPWEVQLRRIDDIFLSNVSIKKTVYEKILAYLDDLKKGEYDEKIKELEIVKRQLKKYEKINTKLKNEEEKLELQLKELKNSNKDKSASIFIVFEEEEKESIKKAIIDRLKQTKKEYDAKTGEEKMRAGFKLLRELEIKIGVDTSREFEKIGVDTSSKLGIISIRDILPREVILIEKFDHIKDDLIQNFIREYKEAEERYKRKKSEYGITEENLSKYLSEEEDILSEIVKAGYEIFLLVEKLKATEIGRKIYKSLLEEKKIEKIKEIEKIRGIVLQSQASMTQRMLTIHKEELEKFEDQKFALQEKIKKLMQIQKESDEISGLLKNFLETKKEEEKESIKKAIIDRLKQTKKEYDAKTGEEKMRAGFKLLRELEKFDPSCNIIDISKIEGMDKEFLLSFKDKRMLLLTEYEIILKKIEAAEKVDLSKELCFELKKLNECKSYILSKIRLYGIKIDKIEEKATSSRITPKTSSLDPRSEFTIPAPASGSGGNQAGGNSSSSPSFSANQNPGTSDTKEGDSNKNPDSNANEGSTNGNKTGSNPPLDPSSSPNLFTTGTSGKQKNGVNENQPDANANKDVPKKTDNSNMNKPNNDSNKLTSNDSFLSKISTFFISTFVNPVYSLFKIFKSWLGFK